MRRREFIAGLGGAAAWPVVARAQQAAMPVVAFFSAGTPAGQAHLVAAFRQGLREAGFIDGQNVTILYHYAQDQYDRLSAMAAEVVRGRPAVIAAGPRAVNAAKAATTTIPIVFQTGADPVRNGLVASLNRPAGNVTGVTILAAELTAKRFGLLHEAVPQAGTIGVLWESSNPDLEVGRQDAEMAARTIGVPVRVIGVRSESEVEAAFATLAREKVGALLVNNSFLFYGLRERLAVLAAQHRIPASYELREHVDVGGLMSYGPSVLEAFRQVGRYTGRILKGEKPADLPVMQPTKFEFVINLKTAKALGLTIPETLLATADEVIQ